MQDLRGKVAVITGSAGGIGAVMAVQMAKEGAKIVVADRRDQPFAILPGTIDETVAAVKAVGGEAIGVRVDLRQEDQIAAMAQETLSHFGTVDIVINNAGIQFTAPIWELPVERWDQVMSVNPRATFLVCKAFLPTLMKKRSGNIINISSPAGRGDGSPNMAVYGASKAAVDYLTLSLAKEVRDYGIAVNCLAPAGAVDTPATRHLFPDEALWRTWEPTEHYVKAAVWLAKQEAGDFTGQLVYSRSLILEQGLCEEWCCATLHGPRKTIPFRNRMFAD